MADGAGMPLSALAPVGPVLLVEDDLTARILLRTALEGAGVVCLEATDGETALVTVHTEPVGAILLDLSLPDMSGFTVLERLKADERTRAIPVLVVTGRTGTAECLEGLALGAHDFVRKPFAIDELVARVGAALALKARLDALAADAAALEELALTDALTGLDNRRSAERHLDRLDAAAARSGGEVGLLLVDVDRFKLLNDRHGHPVGDAVLRVVAERLCAAARDADVVARWGGEEFAVLLPGADAHAALRAGRRLCAAVGAAPVVVDGVAIDVTVSVGTASAAGGAMQGLVAAADAALYRAKAEGRNRVAAAIGHASAAARHALRATYGTAAVDGGALQAATG